MNTNMKVNYLESISIKISEKNLKGTDWETGSSRLIFEQFNILFGVFLFSGLGWVEGCNQSVSAVNF